jgi:WD40 repeat protein
MTVQWEKVYVFISSTFNDMHAERDYLVKQVFPRLQEWCEQRKLRLVDIDLRWGVTEADATQNKRVVQVCLQRIDACRPFFLCFLGQRRGWVPARSDIPSETYAQYPELEKYVGDASVTELEILHALVNPLHRGKIEIEGKVTEYQPAEHAFFFLRQPEYLDSLPTGLKQPESLQSKEKKRPSGAFHQMILAFSRMIGSDGHQHQALPGVDAPTPLRQVYTNEGLETPTERQAADNELNRWRTETIPGTRRPQHNYSARWNLDATTPEIRLPLTCPSTAPHGSPAWQATYTKWAWHWSQTGVKVDEKGEISDPTERSRAEQYNACLTRGRLGDFTCGQQALAETILAELKAAIQARHPEHIESAALTPLQRELDQQEQILRSAGEGFIERFGDFDALDHYVQDQTQQTFFLTAPGGLGKTSLLARWIDRLSLTPAAGESLHYRFIGASDGSTTVDSLLRSILSEIQAAGKLTEEIPADSNKLRAALPQLLEAAGKKGRTVIVLDGLNQLESHLSDLAWLPMRLPPGIRLVLSFKRGEEQAERFYARLHSGGQVLLAEVRPFENLGDRRKLVRAYLEQFLKELDEHHIETLIQAEGADNPLYLKVALAELRVFGAFTDLGEKIQADFGTNPITAFNGVLARLETDPAYSPVPPEQMVPHLFGWLAHARQGLSVEELVGLVLQEKLLHNPLEAEAAVNGLLRQVRQYLARRDGRLDFFYESFKLAVLARYAGTNTAHPQARPGKDWHAFLAAYFAPQPLYLGKEQKPNLRKLAELAFQLAHAGQAEALKKTLWDYAFIEARLEGPDVATLIADYDLISMPEVRLRPEEASVLNLLRDALKLSAYVLEHNKLQLPSQLTGRLLGFEERELCGLMEQIRKEVKHPWLRPLGPCFEQPGGALIYSLEGHTDQVLTCAISADGRRIVSGSRDKTLKIWDAQTRQVHLTLTGHAGAVCTCAISPDGRWILSGSEDYTLRVWDAETGQQCLQLALGDQVNTCAISPDGRWFVSGSGSQNAGNPDTSLKVWDAQTGKELLTLKGHTKPVSACTISADGRWIVSGAGGGVLKIWDSKTGQERQTITGAGAKIDTCSISPDGQWILASSMVLKVLDIRTGRERRKLSPNGMIPVYTSAISPDGRWFLWGGNTIQIWDTDTDDVLQVNEGNGVVRTCAISPDGCWFVTGLLNGLIKVWNVKTGQKQLHENRKLKKLNGPVVACPISPDQQLLVATSNVMGFGAMCKIWGMQANGKELTLIDNSSGGSCAISPDGRWTVMNTSGKLRVCDVKTGPRSQTFIGDSQGVRTLAFSWGTGNGLCRDQAIKVSNFGIP